MDPTFCLPNDSNDKKTAYKFVVDQFSTREGDYPIDSPGFALSGFAGFELVLYPKKDILRGISNCVMIYARKVATYTIEKTLLRCMISIVNKNEEKCCTKEFQFVIGKNGAIESNWIYYISRDYLLDPANELLPYDTLTIFCEISVMGQSEYKPLEIVQQKHNIISSDFQSLFDSKKYSDIVLVSGVTEFSAHKSILSARSPVFSAMFDHDLEEKKQNRVEITDVDAEVLGELLKYIYTGTVSSLEKYSDDLLVAADKYQMDSLKSICEQSLSLGLTIESAMKLSDMHNASKLKANCLEYISRHSTEVTKEHWNAVISARPELTFMLYNALPSKK